jgi:3-hydroxybutyryl-CoA dehydrogenase
VTIERVGIIGAGTMGVGIATVFTRAGLKTTVVDNDPAAIVHATDVLRDVAAHVRFAGSLTAVADCDLVIEAIVESEAPKVALFRSLGQACRTDTVLASNSSSIPIARFGHVAVNPRRVVGMHFFNPAPVQPLVEIVASFATGDDVVARVSRFCVRTLGKHVTHAADRPGFVVNALLIPFVLSAIRMVESAHTSAAMIDDSMRLSCAHAMGPLAFGDMMGLDTVKSIADVLYAEYGEPQFIAPPLLEAMVGSGRLGRKSGEGFYLYESVAS